MSWKKNSKWKEKREGKTPLENEYLDKLVIDVKGVKSYVIVIWKN